MFRSILVVSTDQVSLAGTMKALRATGCQVHGASSFEEAHGRMAVGTPDYLIADERLGAFNGLHLIVRGRANRPGMGGMIVTCSYDRWLESEAARLGIEYMVRPPNPSEWSRPEPTAAVAAEEMSWSRLIREPATPVAGPNHGHAIRS